jgi:26S proteasome regulatory subunit T1
MGKGFGGKKARLSKDNEEKQPHEDDKPREKYTVSLDEGDIALLQRYGIGPYTAKIKKVEQDILFHQNHVNQLVGIQESDTGLSIPSQWDLISDQLMMQEEAPLTVGRCTKILNAGEEDAKYIINLTQVALFS